jgi:hypothetical protein
MAAMSADAALQVGSSERQAIPSKNSKPASRQSAHLLPSCGHVIVPARKVAGANEVLEPLQGWLDGATDGATEKIESHLEI